MTTYNTLAEATTAAIAETVVFWDFSTDPVTEGDTIIDNGVALYPVSFSQDTVTNRSFSVRKAPMDYSSLTPEYNPPEFNTIQIPSSAFALPECPQDSEALVYMLAQEAEASAVGVYPTPRHVARTAEAKHVWELKANSALVKLSNEPKYYTPNLVAEQVTGTLAEPFYWSYYPSAESVGYGYRCAGVDGDGDGIIVNYDAPPNNNTLASGTGTPEGSLAAEVGAVYTDKNGGAGTTLYVKESGTGNTGWVAK